MTQAIDLTKKYQKRTRNKPKVPRHERNMIAAFFVILIIIIFLIPFSTMMTIAALFGVLVLYGIYRFLIY